MTNERINVMKTTWKLLILFEREEHLEQSYDILFNSKMTHKTELRKKVNDHIRGLQGLYSMNHETHSDCRAAAGPCSIQIHLPTGGTYMHQSNIC